VIYLEAKDIEVYTKVGGIIVLILAILLLLVWSGVMKCGTVPFLCDVSDTVFGAPSVLIVYGGSDNYYVNNSSTNPAGKISFDGLGDPQLLANLLRNPSSGIGGNIGANVTLSHIDTVSKENIGDYKIVIVESAKVMTSQQMQMFIDYVTIKNGKLVWVGDSGTVNPEPTDSEGKLYTDINKLKSTLTNPWVRAYENPDNSDEYLIADLSKLIGLDFVKRYCDDDGVRCKDPANNSFRILSDDTKNPLWNLSASFPFSFTAQKDFAIVSPQKNRTGSIVAYLDLGTQLEVKNIQDSTKIIKLPQKIPFVATSSAGLNLPGIKSPVRVVYYAYPLEYLIIDNKKEPIVLKNLYDVLLGRK
jgi:hypothetical protein